MASSDKELEDRLTLVGDQLASPPSDVEELFSLLDQAESILMKVDQSPSQSVHVALRPAMNALIAKELLEHSDIDVKVALASCLSEITRITAPDAPYDDDLMKVIFQMIVAAFSKLDDLSRRTYPKAVLILETVAKVRSCVVMLDLELDALILEMFQHFLNNIRPNHSNNVFASMHLIMTLVLEESEDVSADLLSCLLNSAKKDKEVPTTARNLAEKVISHCALKLKPYLIGIQSSGSLSEYSEIVSSICQGKIDALEQNEKNISGGTLVDDSKFSERIVSDELPQGSVKADQEARSPEKVGTADKLPRSVMNNGNGLRGGGNSIVEPTSPKQKPEQSRRGSQPRHNVVADKGHFVNLESGDVKPDSTLYLKTKKTKGRKLDSSNQVADNSEHSLSSGGKEAPSVPSKPKDHNKEADSSQVEGPSDREAESAAPLEPEDNNDVQLPHSSEYKSVSLSSPTLSESVLDTTRPKRGGRSSGSKVSVKRGVNAVADQHVNTSGEQEPLGNSQILDESLPSDTKDLKKELETVSNSEEKPHKRTSRKVQSETADVGKTGSLLSSSEAKSVEMTAKRGSRNKIKESNSPGKNPKSGTKQPKGKVIVAKDASGETLKNMPSPKSDTKSRSKDDSHLVDGVKTQPWRKRPRSMDKISETPEHGQKLDQSLVGSMIKVWWPDDNKFYDGKVDSFDPHSGKHTIVYNDGDEEVLLLREERFEILGSGSKIERDHEDVPCPTASPEEPQNKKAKGNSGSKQGKTRIALRPGSNEDDNNVTRPKGGPKSMSSKKSNEKSSSKSNNNTPKASSKLKSPGNKPKDDNCTESTSTQDDTTTATTPKISRKDDTLLRSLRKPKAETRKTSSNLEVTPKTNIKSLGEDTPKRASKSKNDSTGTAKHDTQKSNSSESTPKVGRKIKAKGDGTSKNASEECSPEKGTRKVQARELTKNEQGSSASTAKKRVRKGNK